jgi:type III secretory pathway component EscR
VFEEFGFPGGLRQWIRAYKPTKPKSDFWYIFINAVPILCAFIIALTASGILGFRIYLYFVAIMAGNAASHIRGTIQMSQYCPGVVSGSLFLLPLLVISYWYFLGTGKVDLLSTIICLCAGVFFGFYVYGMDIREKDRKKV